MDSQANQSNPVTPPTSSITYSDQPQTVPPPVGTTPPPTNPLPPTSSPPPSPDQNGTGMTILVVLGLLFMYPLGLILMWIFMKKWPTWLKVILTLPIAVFPLLILLAITLIAINPEKQFAQANDTKRRSDVNAILNAVNQYQADNGALPTGVDATPKEISTSGVELCTPLVPTYLAAMPVDPLVNEGLQVAEGECEIAYNTGYSIQVAADGRITVSATKTEIDPVDISVTR